VFENLKERDLFKDIGLDGKMILKMIFAKSGVHLFQNRDRWRALVNKVMTD
jgi:hypothetical protein